VSILSYYNQSRVKKQILFQKTVNAFVKHVDKKCVSSLKNDRFLQYFALKTAKNEKNSEKS